MPTKPVIVWGHEVGKWHYNCKTGLNYVELDEPEASLTGEAAISLPLGWLSWIAQAFDPDNNNNDKDKKNKEKAADNKSKFDKYVKTLQNKGGAAATIGMTMSIELEYPPHPCPDDKKHFAGLSYQYLFTAQAFTVVGATAGSAGVHVAIEGKFKLALASDFIECDCAGNEIALSPGPSGDSVNEED